METTIRPCTVNNLERYAEIYAAAFSGEPWHDPWKREDAGTHIMEILESGHSYGLEFVSDGTVAGFVLGRSTLFHYGRSFEICDLAVDPAYQRRGIAGQLMDRLLSDLRSLGIVNVSLITAGEGTLHAFYEKYGFRNEKQVVLMGRDL